MDKPLIKEIESKSILSKSNLPNCDYAANPYLGCTHGCRYCYATFMKRFSNHPQKWGEFLDVKTWPEITRKNLEDKLITIGSVTDPYLPQERFYRRTRELLEQLENSRAKVTIITKSDLILRDLDLIQKLNEPRIAWSINTLDENFRSDMDRAVSIERRLEAMKKSYDAGILTVCFISPIFPEITDVEGIIERVRDQCNSVWLENLNLRGNFKKEILDYIKTAYPNLLPLYREIYTKKDNHYWEELDQRLNDFSRREGLEYVVNEDKLEKDKPGFPVLVNYFYHERIRKNNK